MTEEGRKEGLEKLWPSRRQYLASLIAAAATRELSVKCDWYFHPPPVNRVIEVWAIIYNRPPLRRLSSGSVLSETSINPPTRFQDELLELSHGRRDVAVHLHGGGQRHSDMCQRDAVPAVGVFNARLCADRIKWHPTVALHSRADWGGEESRIESWVFIVDIRLTGIYNSIEIVASSSSVTRIIARGVQIMTVAKGERFNSNLTGLCFGNREFVNVFPLLNRIDSDLTMRRLW